MTPQRALMAAVVTSVGELSTIAPFFMQLPVTMPRDYAKKIRPQTRRRPAAKRQLPGWLWLFVGGILGAFVTFLVYLWGIAPLPSAASKPPPATKVKTEADSETPKPRFDFYKLLQESEVIVPATDRTRPAENEGAQPAADTEEYVLQVGSFSNQADADRLRAQLILLNLDARIEQVTIRGGEIWHRVM